MSELAPVPTWRKVVAAILDFLTVFFIAGYAIAIFTGDTTAGGFSLDGLPALILFAIVLAYFWLLPKAGGTLWQRILRTRR
jgi:hypothetical protein